MGSVKANKSEEYRQLITSVLNEQPPVVHASEDDEVETHALYDDRRGRYMLYQIGWMNKKRTHSALVYVRIHDDKIWIEEDWTEEGIATELVRAGVPKEDIVLAFHEPKMRQYTDFAIA